MALPQRFPPSQSGEMTDFSTPHYKYTIYFLIKYNEPNFYKSMTNKYQITIHNFQNIELLEYSKYASQDHGSYNQSFFAKSKFF